MSRKRVIYLHPGEIIEFRFVHHACEKNYSGWYSQAWPKSMSYRFKYDLVAPADPMVRFGDFLKNFERYDATGYPKDES